MEEVVVVVFQQLVAGKMEGVGAVLVAGKMVGVDGAVLVQEDVAVAGKMVGVDGAVLVQEDLVVVFGQLEAGTMVGAVLVEVSAMAPGHRRRGILLPSLRPASSMEEPASAHQQRHHHQHQQHKHLQDSVPGDQHLHDYPMPGAFDPSYDQSLVGTSSTYPENYDAA